MLKLRKVTTTLGSIGCVLALSACSKSLDCASNQAKEMVIDIVGKTLKKRYSSDEGKIEFDYSLSDIRIESNDERLKKITCAATLKVHNYLTLYKEASKSEDLNDEILALWKFGYVARNIATPLNKTAEFEQYWPVTYKLEENSEGKLYATVYGLR
jgi:hypothetical protein